MEKFTKAYLDNIAAMRLTHKTLYRLDDDLIERRYIDTVAEVLDRLDGSRVELYMVPYDDKSGVFLQLRCGEHKSDKLIPGYLSGVLELAPFIAACAGRAKPEPDKLEELKGRVTRLEERVGIKGES